MEFAEDSLDAVLFKLYRALEVNGQQNVGSRGNTRELISVTLNIKKPRARLSISENRGKPFSALGELLWYLSGSNTLKFIEPYVPVYKDDAVDGILEGAYGPRLLNMRGGINQFDSVHQLLKKKWFEARRHPTFQCRGYLYRAQRNSVYHDHAVPSAQWYPAHVGYDAFQRRLLGASPRRVLLHHDSGDDGT